MDTHPMTEAGFVFVDGEGLDTAAAHRLILGCVVPRLAATPVQMECRLDQAVTLGRGINTLHVGAVVAFHLSRRVFDGNRVDSAAMPPIARLGGPFYAALGEIIHRPMLQRPPGGEGFAG